MRRGVYKLKILEMHLKLKGQHLKTISFIDYYIKLNCKLKINNKYTHTKGKMKLNTTLKLGIKS